MLKHVGASLRALNLSDKQVLHMHIGNHMEIEVSEVAPSGTGTIHGIIVSQALVLFCLLTLSFSILSFSSLLD